MITVVSIITFIHAKLILIFGAIIIILHDVVTLHEGLFISLLWQQRHYTTLSVTITLQPVLLSGNSMVDESKVTAPNTMKHFSVTAAAYH